MARSPAKGNPVTALYSDFPDDEGVWRLEMSKACLGDAAEGSRARWLPCRLEFIAAAGAAACIWIFTLIRSLHESSHIRGQTGNLVAVYGEWANRTRHILIALAEGGASMPILIVGRRKQSLRAIAACFEREAGLSRPQLLRPYDLRSAALSAPAALKRIAAGMKLLNHLPGRPPFREQVAMLFRMFQGSASAAWWRRQKLSTDAVIFGHTGLADTTLLELAQQSTGAKTLHWAHGLSKGINFTGLSSVGLFQCGHDANWHARLGGYGQCRHVPLEPPAYCAGSDGWLVYSNLIHPMNRSFQRSGARDELALLERVASLADRFGLQRGEITWNFHPEFRHVDAAIQAQVLQAVTRLGIQVWDMARPMRDARGFRVVMTTPSTIATDMLRLGILPVIVECSAPAEHVALSQFPLRADDDRSLADAIGRYDRPEEIVALYRQAWLAVGPGAQPDMRMVLELARR